MPVRYYKYDKPFVLENGERLPELQIAYHTYGKFKGNNAIWVCHALTANSDVADWWPRTVEQGRFLDPRRYYVVCANVIGSHYGSTGPLSLNPATGKPYYGSFPFITVRDMVNAHLLLADHLGVGSVRAVIGSSIGGFQALEMALARPGFAERLALIATAARSQPWTIAFNESHGHRGRRNVRRRRRRGRKARHARLPLGRTAELPGLVGLQRDAAGKRQPVQGGRLPGHHLSAVSGRQALSPLRRLFLLPTDAGFRFAQRGPLPGRRRSGVRR